jgi:hypothetical protein
MEATTPHYYAGLAADYLEEQAAWRQRKADEWPDDPRNARSAAALAAAATYVRQLDDSHRQLDLLAGLDAELEAWQHGGSLDAGTGALTVDEQASGTVARFCFDNEATTPGPRQFEWLLGQVVAGAAGSLRDEIEAGTSQPPGSLVELLAELGAPLWEDDEEEAEEDA